MAWTCEFCRTSYARRKDHDEASNAMDCKRAAIEKAQAEYSVLLKKRKEENPSSGFMDKELNRAWAKLRRLEGKR